MLLPTAKQSTLPIAQTLNQRKEFVNAALNRVIGFGVARFRDLARHIRFCDVCAQTPSPSDALAVKNKFSERARSGGLRTLRSTGARPYAAVTPRSPQIDGRRPRGLVGQQQIHLEAATVAIPIHCFCPRAKSLARASL